MATERSLPPSFTPGRKWSAGTAKLVGVIAFLAIVLMVNFISRNYFFHRAFVSTQNTTKLSPQTLGLVKSVTNDVKIILYYDRTDALFAQINGLANEYRLANPKISVEVVDYTRDPAKAQLVKAKFKLASAAEKNLVIFECGERSKWSPGDAMMDYTREQDRAAKQLEFIKRPVAFNGEVRCSAMLLMVTNPKPQRAGYLMGHGEHDADSEEEQTGYKKFVTAIFANYVSLEPVNLAGTNAALSDFEMLVIAGPKAPLPDAEIAKISQYLEQGGRLLMLFNYASVNKQPGLEKMLAKWGVNVSSHIVKDEQQSNSREGQDIIIRQFSKHPVVNALQDSSIHVILPREISRIETSSTAADASTVDEIAFTSPASTLLDQTNAPAKSRSIAVAVEKGAVGGVVNVRGTTRIIVTGDSVFLGNQMIESAANRDFHSLAINWLLDRPQFLQGLGPRKVTDIKIAMTQAQLKSTYIILLAGMPGAALMVGWLVWLRRRN